MPLKKLIEQCGIRVYKEALRILFAFAKEKGMTSVAQNRGWALCIVFFLALGILQAKRALYASDAVREVRIRAPQSESDVAHSYFRELLALALKKTDAEYGPAKVVVTSLNITQNRALAFLNKGDHVDINWSGTN